MRIARFARGDEVGYGAVEGQNIIELAGHPFGQIAFSGDKYPLDEVRLLAPVIPSKVVAIGKNYHDHAAEMGGPAPIAPLMFLKPSTSVVGPGDPIVYPEDTEELSYEGELAVVIGRICKDVPAARSDEVIFGYTIANDVTCRDQQRSDGQWTRAKGHDTFCPLGPWITTEVDVSDVALTTTVNGELKQSGRTALLIHSIPTLIEYVSRAMTLIPGDVLLTGTPAGVGPIVPGDSVAITIEGLGTLENRVVAK